jgi:hypothetical protein
VSAADVARAAQTAIRPDSALVVVVGDGTKIHDALAAIAPVLIVNAQGDPLTPADLSPTAAPVTLDPGRLAARRDSFAFMVQGREFGHLTEVVERTADGWTVTQVTVLGPVGTQTTTFTLSDRLEMRRVQQTGKLGGNDVGLDVTYADGRATGSARSPQPTGGVEAVTVNAEVPPGVIDDNAVGTLLSTLPWAPNARFTLPVFASGKGTMQPATLSVTGTEQVTVPAGTFQAFRVESVGGQSAVTYWVEQAAPHRLLKMQPGGTPLELVRVR